jgi:hypothetical protein
LEKTISGDSLIFAVDMRKSDRKDFIEGVVTLFIRELKLESSKVQLAIFTKKGFEKETGAAGMVYPYGKSIITMDIDSQLSPERLVDVLSHEMVHVKQIAKGQLKYKGKKLYWKGNYVNHKKLSYYDHPWEHEAWKNQKILASKVWRILEEIGAIDKVVMREL